MRRTIGWMLIGLMAGWAVSAHAWNPHQNRQRAERPTASLDKQAAADAEASLKRVKEKLEVIGANFAQLRKNRVRIEELEATLRPGVPSGDGLADGRFDEKPHKALGDLPKLANQNYQLAKDLATLIEAMEDDLGLKGPVGPDNPGIPLYYLFNDPPHRLSEPVDVMAKELAPEPQCVSLIEGCKAEACYECCSGDPFCAWLCFANEARCTGDSGDTESGGDPPSDEDKFRDHFEESREMLKLLLEMADSLREGSGTGAQQIQ